MDRDSAGAYVVESSEDGRAVTRILPSDDTKRYQAIVNLILGKDGDK